MKHQFLEHFGSLQKPAAGAGGGHGKLASARELSGALELWLAHRKANIQLQRKWMSLFGTPRCMPSTESSLRRFAQLK
eukprot:symbB.v1.2.034900.t1/scaffold4589.1/size37648/2